MSRELLKFDDLAPYLLLKNGNFLYRIPFRGGWAVLKVYFGSRGTLGRIHKSLNNVLFYGQTSYMPRTRCRVERECIHLWRSHGFRVFDLYEDVEVEAPSCVSGGYMLFEYVKAPRLVDHIQNEDIPLETRFEKYRQFLGDWGRRHALAIEHREPRLVHENGDGKHVLILPDGDLLWFDFEMTFRHPHRVEEHVSHEIVQFLWFLLKVLPPALAERVLQETITHYPSRERLAVAHDYFFHHPRPLLRLGRALDRKFRARAQKKTSKYNVAAKLKAALDAKKAFQPG
jgi:hypothetical protein